MMINLTGQRFGRLIVIKRDGTSKKGGNVLWLCRCNCGQKIIVQAPNLKNNNTQSCGCLRKEVTARQFIKHGHTKNGKITKIYYTWASMIQRCINPNNSMYKYYGGRGIVICKQWEKFENFNEDMGKNWKPGLTIERKNNNKGYSLRNCCWSTPKQQARNRRGNLYVTYNEKTQLLVKWAEEIKIHYKVLWKRIYIFKWSIKKALTIPIRKRKINE